MLAYYGDDDVVYENLADVPLITWLSKDLKEDTPGVLAALKARPTLAEFRESQAVLEKLAGHYLEKFLANTQLYQGVKFDLTKITSADIPACRKQIEVILGSPLAPWYIKLYRYLKKTPLKILLNY